MSALDELVNTCLLPGVTGDTVPRWVAQGLEAGFPGITIFPGPHLRQSDVIARLSATVREIHPDALVSLDEEGGDVTRLEYGTGSSFPGNLALGIVDDLDLTRRAAEVIAQNLLQNGVNYNLAPSVDANSDSDNPIIGVRSFGDDPGQVAAHGAAFIKAMQSRGVAVAAKHFPGHGATTADPHHTLPVVTCSKETLRRRELVPFRAALDAGAQSLMIAHVMYEALDADRPATLSAPILRDLLRGELGYQGVVLSTAVAIEAGNAPDRIGDVAVQALDAGSDLLLLGPAVDERLHLRIRGAITEAVREKRLDPAVLETAAARVTALQRWARSQIRRPESCTAADETVGQEAARRAVQAHGSVRLAEPATVVELRPATSVTVGEAHWSLIEQLLPSGLVSRGLRVHGPADALPTATGPVVIVVRDAYRSQWQREWLQKAFIDRPDAILVAVGMPDDAKLAAGPCITTFGAGASNIRAAVELLSAGRGLIADGNDA